MLFSCFFVVVVVCVSLLCLYLPRPFFELLLLLFTRHCSFCIVFLKLYSNIYKDKRKCVQFIQFRILFVVCGCFWCDIRRWLVLGIKLFVSCALVLASFFYFFQFLPIFFLLLLYFSVLLFPLSTFCYCFKVFNSAHSPIKYSKLRYKTECINVYNCKSNRTLVCINGARSKTKTMRNGSNFARPLTKKKNTHTHKGSRTKDMNVIVGDSDRGET